MDEREAGNLPNKTGSKTAAKSRNSSRGKSQAKQTVRMVSPTGEEY